MNTVQEPLTDAIPPFPFFIQNPAELNRAELPANKASINEATSLPAACDVQASAANVYQQDELRGVNKVLDTNPLPARCQFTFSDDRQCRMGRSEIHPSLCRFHAEREEQLFGDPAPGGNVVGAALDLPELHSACRDLTTAAGVNRALAQVFRLLAQRRISRQEAATFGYLAQLLLRSISAARAEYVAAFDVSAGESHGHHELSPVNKVALFAGNKAVPSPPSADEPRDLPVSPPVSKNGPERGAGCAPRMGSRETSPDLGVSPASSPDAQTTSAPQNSGAATSPDYQSLRCPSLGVVRAAPIPNSQVSRNEHLRNFST